MLKISFAMVVRVVRTPLVLLVLLLLALFSQTLLPNLLLLLNYYSPLELVARSQRWRLDQILYLPNLVIFLVSLVAAFAFIEGKYVLYRRNRSFRADVYTALAALSIASVPLWFSSNLTGSSFRLLYNVGMESVVLCGFMLCNARLHAFDRSVSRWTWWPSVAAWTFPVSDVVFYIPQRERLQKVPSVLRFLPGTCYAAIALITLGLQSVVLLDALPARRLEIPVAFSNWVEYTPRGFWFANSSWADATSGIWAYDQESRSSKPHIRILDLHKFYLKSGFFYFYDRFDSEVLKIDAETRRVEWRTPVKQGHGSFELALRGDLLFAIGENGYILVLDRDGRVRAERKFPFKTWHPQVLPDGRIAFVAGDPQLRIWRGDLTSGETIPFPLDDGIVRLPYGDRQSRRMTVSVWSDFVEESQILYLATTWGEIFRYDVRGARWLPSFRTRPILRSLHADSRRGLLFASNYYQGFIDILDLSTGSHLKYVLAKPLPRFINSDPQGNTGIVSTKGHGIYEFDLGEALTAKAQASRRSEAIDSYGAR